VWPTVPIGFFVSIPCAAGRRLRKTGTAPSTERPWSHTMCRRHSRAGGPDRRTIKTPARFVVAIVRPGHWFNTKIGVQISPTSRRPRSGRPSPGSPAESGRVIIPRTAAGCWRPSDLAGFIQLAADRACIPAMSSLGPQRRLPAQTITTINAWQCQPRVPLKE